MVQRRKIKGKYGSRSYRRQLKKKNDHVSSGYVPGMNEEQVGREKRGDFLPPPFEKEKKAEKLNLLRVTARCVNQEKKFGNRQDQKEEVKN